MSSVLQIHQSLHFSRVHAAAEARGSVMLYKPHRAVRVLARKQCQGCTGMTCGAPLSEHACFLCAARPSARR